MPKIKFEHVVSCSSEDTVHLANNLLNNDTTKKWKSKNVGEKSISVIIQLDKSCQISGVDIGNENSSFVEVLVGKSSSQDQDYQILLAMSSFMTPMEARNLTNNNRVRLFTSSDLATPARDENWDRIKIVCTQPFNKHVQYGLSFITLHSPQEKIAEESSGNVSLGKFTLRAESPNFLTAGSLFARRKELAGQKETLVQEIKTSVTTPKCKEIKIAPSSSKVEQTENKLKNRNRQNLFFDSDDEAQNEKIDKVVEKAKLEEEKRKLDASKNKITPKKNIDDSASSSSSKRKQATTPKVTKKKIKLVTKPFNELLSGVVFTISGIVNPERANLRQMALNMGARYRPDWDATCSHLICAFANTPKFQQVQGKGKIVTKNWIKDCHSQRKYLPWRRFALDRNDQGKPESDDEIAEKTDEPEEEEEPVEIVAKEAKKVTDLSDYLSGSDTDEEIEKILAKQKEKQHKNGDKIDPFDVDTEEEKLEKNVKDISEEIPKIFKTEIFYIDNVFSDEEKSNLERLIKAFNGVVLTRISNILDFIITTEESLENIKSRCASAQFVSPKWLYECHDALKLIPVDQFVITS